MTPHSSTLAWEIPWTAETGRLQSMGSQRVGHDLVTKWQQIYTCSIKKGTNKPVQLYSYFVLPSCGADKLYRVPASHKLEAVTFLQLCFNSWAIVLCNKWQLEGAARIRGMKVWSSIKSFEFELVQMSTAKVADTRCMDERVTTAAPTHPAQFLQPTTDRFSLCSQTALAQVFTSSWGPLCTFCLRILKMSLR